MHATLIYTGRAGARVRNPRVHGTDLYLEVRSDITRIVRLGIAKAPQGRDLPDAHPDNAWLTIDGDQLVYLTADSTLTTVSFEGGAAQALCTLAPAPYAIAVTPEYVVWCSMQAGNGEIWRWWRNTARVERLGTHESGRPLLAVRPVPLPYPAERVTTDVAIAAGRMIGLIDVEGVDWIGEVDESILELACTTERIIAATEHWLIDFDLDTEQWERTFEIPGPPLALIASDDRSIVAHDCRPEVDDHVAGVWEVTREGVARETDWLADPRYVRGRIELAAASDGTIVIDDGRSQDEIDRVTYTPDGSTPYDYDQTLQIQRWLPDGRGAHLMVEDVEWWCGMASGSIDRATFHRVNEWLKSTPTPDLDTAGPRGWRISIGDTVWRCEDDELSEHAGAIHDLISILAPHIPPLEVVAGLRALR